jgi:Eco57I restriction-modification methylase/TaqI-like C-terminal specificity domain
MILLSAATEERAGLGQGPVLVANSKLMALDLRWPTGLLVDRFRVACLELTKAPNGRATAKEWPSALVTYVKGRISERLSIIRGRSDESKVALRELSALASMLMHMRAHTTSRGNLKLVNQRRSRTDYSTYPTSPLVAEALANYIWAKLAPWRAQATRPTIILDPSMEGGPLLLEIAFQAMFPDRSAAQNLSTPVLLAGVDKNPAAAHLVSAILSARLARGVHPHIKLDLRCANALDVLADCEPLDAVINNPPWGATTDGADHEKLVLCGPYKGYRDPYIAFVASSLRCLRPERPFGFVLPFQVLTAASASSLREELLENCSLDHIVLLPRSAFPHATVKTVAIMGRRRRVGEKTRRIAIVRYPFARRLSDGCEPAAGELDERLIRVLGPRPWLPVVRFEPPFSSSAPTSPLGALAHVVLGIEPYRTGRGRPKQTSTVLAARPFTFDRAGKATTPVVCSKDISRYWVGSASEHIRIGPWLASAGNHKQLAFRPRVFVRQICGRDGSLVAAPAPKGAVARYGVFTIVCNRVSPEILPALLNSSAAARYVRSDCSGFHKESFGRVSAPDLRSFPVPAIFARGAGGSEGQIFRRALRHAVRRVRYAVETGPRSKTADLYRLIDKTVDEAFCADLATPEGGRLPRQFTRIVTVSGNEAAYDVREG